MGGSSWRPDPRGLTSVSEGGLELVLAASRLMLARAVFARGGKGFPAIALPSRASADRPVSRRFHEF